MSEFDLEEPLTSTARPCKNVKNHVFPHVDLVNTTPRQLFDMIINTINTTGALRAYRNVNYDTLKIYTHAHGSKTMNLVINMEHDEDWVLDLKDDTKKLTNYDIANETELSIFNWSDYEKFKADPQEKW
ncbi:hypothetical protein OGAPHI_006146 [Ogataea philodendri]|uniref:Altered inheritance rate of mitochondria protein 29 n=1 Tax=Ogataea philodendri TaxID=1378263 RepID=A0A9P8NYL9_9ASCO|nr:uncharacterized protein OGAPHI_006146 [Ogataea philodendri]KAH3661967.1 hypothetical protein OGAPHI_006146 [Ogataea philodendri]